MNSADKRRCVKRAAFIHENRVLVFSEPLTRLVSKRRKKERLLHWVIFPLLVVLGALVLIGVLTLLIYGLDAAWVWLRVRVADVQPVSLPDLAVAPVTKGAVLGLLAFGTVLAVFLAVRKARRNEEEAAKSYWRAVEEEEAAAEMGPDPLSAPYLGLDAADVRRILDAATVECCTVEELVRKAETSLSVEDYGQRLAGARHALKGMKLCLAQLAARFGGVAQPGGKGV